MTWCRRLCQKCVCKVSILKYDYFWPFLMDFLIYGVIIYTLRGGGGVVLCKDAVFCFRRGVIIFIQILIGVHLFLCLPFPLKGYNLLYPCPKVLPPCPSLHFVKNGQSLERAKNTKRVHFKWSSIGLLFPLAMKMPKKGQNIVCTVANNLLSKN